MINDVDESLRALFRREVLAGTDVEVSFEAPTKDWAARRSAPVVNVYLYDIREDLERRQVQFEELRRPVNGREVTADRRTPPRRFKLSYLVTAWTQRPEDEHRLLASILGCLIRSDALPRDVLGGQLAEVVEPGTEPDPVRVTVALPPSGDKSTSDLWTALGGQLKPSLDVVVTARFDPARSDVVGELVQEPPVLDFGDTGVHAEGRRERVAMSRRRRHPD